MEIISRRRIGIFEALRISEFIFMRNIGAIFKIIVFLVLPINLLIEVPNTALSNIYEKTNLAGMFESISNMNITSYLELGEKITSFISIEELYKISLISFGVMFLQGLFMPLITTAIAKLVSNYVEKKEISAKVIIIESLSNGSKLIISTIIYMLLLTFGLYLFIIPGMIFYFIFTFYVYDIGIKGSGVIESIKNSSSMVKGKLLTIIGYKIIFSIFNIVFTFLTVFLLGFIGADYFNNVLISTISCIGTIICYIGYTILYINIDKGGYYRVI